MECRCTHDFCECISTRKDTDGFLHCYQCPLSKKMMGGGLECYGVFEGFKGYRDIDEI